MAATGLFFTDEFVPVMEEKLFMEPVDEFIFHQFTMELEDFTKKPGEVKRVTGPTFLAKVSNPDTDRMLADIGDKVSDNAPQHPDLNKQEVSINEFLLKNALIVQEYEAARSFHDLAAINGTVLAYDYHQWRDEIIKKRFTSSTYVRYASGAANAAALTTSNKISIDELVITAATLSNRNIPRYPDGTYVAIIDDSTLATLYTEQKFLDASTRALASQAPLFRGEMTTVAGIKFVKSTNLDTVVGDSDGTPFDASQVLMFGTSNFGMFPLGTADGLVKQERLDWLKGMGAGPVVTVRGMPVEVRLREVTDYGRFQEMIWIEHTGYSILDPNPGSGKTTGVDSRFVQKLVGATVLS